jgi:cytochrome c553
MLKIASLAAALSVFALTLPAHAESFTPIKDPKIIAACGECHMTYFPQMLPQASWTKILSDPSNHFGEDATLDPTTQDYVLNYYLNDAADVQSTRAAKKWMAGVDLKSPPSSISTAPRFVQKHDEREFTTMWNRKNVKSKSDCAACHKDAQRGIFEDD